MHAALPAAMMGVGLAVAAQAQPLSVSNATCIEEVVSSGQKARLVTDFIARDGRIFTCSGTVMVPNSPDLRPRIEDARCSLARTAMAGGDGTGTAYFTQRGSAPGVCTLDLTMQANLGSGKARFCAFRAPTELCKTIPLTEGRR